MRTIITFNTQFSTLSMCLKKLFKAGGRRPNQETNLSLSCYYCPSLANYKKKEIQMSKIWFFYIICNLKHEQRSIFYQKIYNKIRPLTCAVCSMYRHIPHILMTKVR